MEIEFTLKAKEDIDFWKNSGNNQVKNKITNLLLSIQNSPFTGIGKPEQLRHEWRGYWSRSINREHRLIYEIHDNKIIIHSLKGHYE